MAMNDAAPSPRDSTPVPPDAAAHEDSPASPGGSSASLLGVTPLQDSTTSLQVSDSQSQESRTVDQMIPRYRTRRSVRQVWSLSNVPSSRESSATQTGSYPQEESAGQFQDDMTPSEAEEFAITSAPYPEKGNPGASRDDRDSAAAGAKSARAQDCTDSDISRLLISSSEDEEESVGVATSQDLLQRFQQEQQTDNGAVDVVAISNDELIAENTDTDQHKRSSPSSFEHQSLQKRRRTAMLEKAHLRMLSPANSPVNFWVFFSHLRQYMRICEGTPLARQLSISAFSLTPFVACEMRAVMYGKEALHSPAPVVPLAKRCKL
ncbi:hypothetical protein LTR49_028382 [Elasticomyces elasticus]|nr:hypothetical protein LTR49_028382 [Elasticomyces elasticus]